MLFHPARSFEGLPPEGFEVFGLRDREQRRREIIRLIHPALERLAADLLDELNERAAEPLRAHLPRLDWPRGYQPFCTWLALSREHHGYLGAAQLNVGVHADEVSVRLGWDTSADAFGRFEFLCRHGEIGRELSDVAAEHGLRIRVFASAPWPRGSEKVFDSPTDLVGSFEAVRRCGVWWEVGRPYAVPEERERVCSDELGREASRIFGALLPVYERIAGERGAVDGPTS